MKQKNQNYLPQRLSVRKSKPGKALLLLAEDSEVFRIPWVDGKQQKVYFFPLSNTILYNPWGSSIEWTINCFIQQIKETSQETLGNDSKEWTVEWKLHRKGLGNDSKEWTL